MDFAKGFSYIFLLKFPPPLPFQERVIWLVVVLSSGTGQQLEGNEEIRRIEKKRNEGNFLILFFLLLYIINQNEDTTEII